MSGTREQLAIEAFIYGLPLYEMARMRAATSPRRVEGYGNAGEHANSTLRWCNTFIHTRKRLSAGGSRVVTPNNDTLYSNAWLDLGDAPLRLDVPDTAGRYYVLGLLDFFTNPFAHIGQRLTGTGARAFLIVGPGWDGALPAGIAAGDVIESPTRWVWIIGRILAGGEHDLTAVHALQDRFSLRAPGAARPEPKRFDAALDPRAPLTGERFLQTVGAALRDNPPPAGQAHWPPRFADLDADALQGAILPALAHIRAAGHGAATQRQGWSTPAFIGSSFGTDYLARAAIALDYIGMLESREATYPMAWHDAAGETLDGNHGYRLHFAPGGLPPVDAFWSLTLYDAATRMLIDNAIDRYSIGDRSEGLRHDADGGLTLFIQHAPPHEAAQHANWLPAPAAAPFYLCLRLYLPRPAVFDGSYRLPPVQRVEAC